MPGTHALLSPSSSSRWMTCPGSVQASAGIVSPDSDYSREGTAAHAEAAACLLEGRNVRPGTIGTPDTGPIQLSTTDAAALQSYVDKVREIVLLEDGDLMVEQAVEVSRDCYGTADAIVLSGDGKTLHVLDLKFGAGIEVDVMDNPQLKLYGLGALNKLGNRERIFGVETVQLYIVQPRVKGASFEPWAISRTDLLAWLQVVYDAERATKEPNAPLVPGSHCRFCPAAAGCRALSDRASLIAGTVFSDLTVQAPQPKPAPTLSNEQLIRAREFASTLRAWSKAVDTEFARRVAAGEVPGWKMVQKIARNRAWIDDDVAAGHLLAHGIDPYERVLSSPAAIEKRAGRSAKSLVASLTHKPVSGIVPAPASDPRAPVALTADSVFSDLGDSDD